MKGARGQFYIVAAVIIVIVIIGLSTISNYAIVRKKSVKFYDLSTEINEEGARIIDYGIYNEKNITNITESFLDRYAAEYAQEKEKGVELTFIYGDRDSARIVNYAKESSGDIEVVYGTRFRIPGKGRTVASRGEPCVGCEEVTITLLGNDYVFDIGEGENFLFVIRKEKEGETYVGISEGD